MGPVPVRARVAPRVRARRLGRGSGAGAGAGCVGRGHVRICCKGTPSRDRRREEARNINDSLRAPRRDRGLCNGFGQPAPPRSPRVAPRVGRRPRWAPPLTPRGALRTRKCSSNRRSREQNAHLECEVHVSTSGRRTPRPTSTSLNPRARTSSRRARGLSDVLANPAAARPDAPARPPRINESLSPEGSRGGSGVMRWCRRASAGWVRVRGVGAAPPGPDVRHRGNDGRCCTFDRDRPATDRRNHAETLRRSTPLKSSHVQRGPLCTWEPAH